MASGQHKVGRFVTSRDSHPVCVDDGDLSAMAGSCGALAVHLTTPGAVSPERPILAADRIRFVGEMIAAVVADTRYAAADAVNLMSPDIEPLPAVVTFEDAMAENAPLVHEAVPENLYYLGHRAYGNVEQAFEQADVIVEGEVTNPR